MKTVTLELTDAMDIALAMSVIQSQPDLYWKDVSPRHGNVPKNVTITLVPGHGGSMRAAIAELVRLEFVTAEEVGVKKKVA